MKSVLAFYKFLEIEDLHELRLELLEQGASLELKGTILIAREGINSTLVGQKKNLEAFSYWLTNRFGSFPFKWPLKRETPKSISKPIAKRLKIFLLPH